MVRSRNAGPGVCLAFALAAGAAAPVAAQPVWRCGNSYSNEPCAGGTRLGPGAQRPAAADAARAQANARRDFELADRLERERLAREARAPRAVLPPAPAPAASAPPSGERAAKGAGKGAKGKKKKEPDHFTAVSPR